MAGPSSRCPTHGCRDDPSRRSGERGLPQRVRLRAPSLGSSCPALCRVGLQPRRPPSLRPFLPCDRGVPASPRGGGVLRGAPRAAPARLPGPCVRDSHVPMPAALPPSRSALSVSQNRRLAGLFTLGSSPPPSCTSSRAPASDRAAGQPPASRQTALPTRPASSFSCIPGLRTSRVPISPMTSGVGSAARPNSPRPGESSCAPCTSSRPVRTAPSG